MVFSLKKEQDCFTMSKDGQNSLAMEQVTKERVLL